MSKLTLLTYPDNPRAWKAQIASKYAGVEIETPHFEFGKDNRTKEFLEANPVGKVPVLQTPEGNLFESNAIARYVARHGHNLFGSNSFEAGQVDQWIDFASNEIDLPAAAWLFPILEIVPENREATGKAKGDIRKALGILNSHLTTRTFLVGERISLADIIVSMSLHRLYKLVLDPGFRKGWPHLNRWYLTLVHQPEFASVIGATTLCEKMLVAKAAAPAAAKPKEAKPKEQQPKKEAAPKPAAAKPKEAEEEGDDDEKPQKKEKSALDSLPKSKMDLDEWKRTYSNEHIRDVALPWLWKNFDSEGYSLWYADYLYNNECTKNFMTSNLIGGFLQRLDKLRRYGFGSLLIFGDEPNLQVAGIWLFRGLEVPQEMREVDDYPHYTWKKLDPQNEHDRKLVEDYFAWNGDFGGRPAFHDKGKVFK